MVVVIPRALAQATVSREGDVGQAWLNDLPLIVGQACQRWKCVPDGDAWHGQVALVVPVLRASGPAALKISFPHDGNRGEAEALRTFNGRGAVQLIEADDYGSVLLLERAGPMSLADSLSAGSGPTLEQALEIAGHLARQLAVPATSEIITLASTMQEWQKQLDVQTAEAPQLMSKAAIARARQTMHHLAGDATSTMLHGDLHFGNILKGRRQPWLTIDPKGWSGSSAWDAFTVIAARPKTPQHLSSHPHCSMSDRIRRFSAAAGIDPELAAACCQARAVSSYLYQHIMAGSWFDPELLRTLAEGD